MQSDTFWTVVAALCVVSFVAFAAQDVQPASTEAAVDLGEVIRYGAPQTEPSTQPVLTEVQRLQILALRQEIEIHRLRLQASTTRLSSLVDTLQVPGYQLDLDQLRYVQVPADGS